jgi:hypothetical protein
MLMKIVTYALIALLVAALGVAALFYMNTYQPMAADYERMKAGLPEFDKAKAELKKCKERESRENQERAWLSPVLDTLASGLADDIKAGRAEVLSAESRVIVNIAEDALYLPGSYTFSKESPRLRETLVALLRKNELAGKDIRIGNMTEGVPAKGRGRKKIPAKDARTLASERSAALVRDLEKNGVAQDALIAAAYSAKHPSLGNRLTARKTVIVVEKRPAGAAGPAKQAPAAAPAAAPQARPQMIPIRPAQPKTP